MQTSRQPGRRGSAQVIQFAVPGLRRYSVAAISMDGIKSTRTVWATDACDAVNQMQDLLGYIPRRCIPTLDEGRRTNGFGDTEPVAQTTPAKLDAPTVREVAQMQLESQRVAAHDRAMARAARQKAIGYLLVFGAMFCAGAAGLVKLLTGGAA